MYIKNRLHILQRDTTKIQCLHIDTNISYKSALYLKLDIDTINSYQPVLYLERQIGTINSYQSASYYDCHNCTNVTDSYELTSY